MQPENPDVKMDVSVLLINEGTCIAKKDNLIAFTVSMNDLGFTADDKTSFGTNIRDEITNALSFELDYLIKKYFEMKDNGELGNTYKVNVTYDENTSIIIDQQKENII